MSLVMGLAIAFYAVVVACVGLAVVVVAYLAYGITLAVRHLIGRAR